MSFMDIDVVSFLEELGVNNVQEHGDEVSYSCPFDGHTRGDSTPSASMNLHTTGFNCWGCGQHGNAVNFLSILEGVSYHRAKRFIKERFQVARKFEEGSMTDEVTRVLERKRSSNQGPIDEEELQIRLVDWDMAKQAVDSGQEDHGPFHYMLSVRGFTPETLDRWEVGFDVVSSHWVAIPYRDVEGRLVGFKGRTWVPDRRPRYRVLGGDGYGFEPFEVGRHVFGLHRIQGIGPLIVIEGELNTMIMDQHGFDRSVGFSGQHLSKHQVSLIAMRANQVLLIMDDHEKALKAASQLHSRVPVSIAPEHESDPCDSSLEEIEELVRGARRFDMMTSKG